MVTRSARTAVARSADGFAELAAGNWKAAKRRFETALRDGQDPVFLEGLSWAAWWLDEAESVFSCRERAYRLYRQRGDAAGAARVAVWLAVDHLDFHGAPVVAAAWLRRAARLLEPLPTGPEHGWLVFQEGYLAHLAGDSSAAGRCGRTAADIGRRHGVADLEMLGLALEGGALVAEARVTEGMRCLDEATVAALGGEATVPISSAWTFCFMVSACLEVQDYERAFEWCDRIAEFARRYQSRYMFGFCRSHYGAVELRRGRWNEAEAQLTTAAGDYERSRPALVGDALVWLAELRRRQGRTAEAIELLDRTGEGIAALVCRSRLAMDDGNAPAAIEHLDRALRQIAGERVLDRAPALELLARARIAVGDLAGATAAIAHLRELGTRLDNLAIRAGAQLTEAAHAAAVGDHATARRLREDAADALTGGGAVYEALVARVDLASSLLALGRVRAAEEMAGRALDGLVALGAVVEATRARRVVAECTEDAYPDQLGSITRREREVLRLVARGLTNRRIAEHLVVSEHTIHRHVTNLLRKLDLPSRTAAATFAARSGLLDEDG